MKYIHKFNSKLTCSVEIMDRKPEPGEHHILSSVWSQRPTKKHTQEYLRWMHVVNDNYAKQFGLRLMHVYQLSPRYNDWQIWAYDPHKPPFRMQMPDLPGGPPDIDSLNKSMEKLIDSSFLIDHQTIKKSA